jgi:catalase
MDDAARDRLVANIVGHVVNGVHEPVLSRVFEYWTNIDAEVGKKIEEAVRDRLA